MSAVTHILKGLVLAPLSGVYGVVVGIRNWLYDFKILPSKEFDFPVISVGNITIGGTGKTPHTEYLISFLKNEMGIRVAMVSRGYKRKTHGMVVADLQSTARDIGDEPFQIKSKFADIDVIVDKKRERAIRYLREQHENPPQVVLMDDAFQYRKIIPGISILLIDYNRLIYHDHLLPYGRLRESSSNKDRAEIIIITKCPKTIRPIDMRIIHKELNPTPTQTIYFSTFDYGEIYPLFATENVETKNSLHEAEGEVLVVTGVASPEGLYKHVWDNMGKYEQTRFSDHHSFTKENWHKIENRFNQLHAKKKIILVTEKDAARILCDPNVPISIKDKIYSIPLRVEFLQNMENDFKKQVVDYVVRNKRIGRV